MKKELLNIIICPQCHNNSFILNIDIKNDLEIRKGCLVCNNCEHKYSIEQGILDLLLEDTDIIKNEQKGWDRLKQAVEHSEELMLSLPDALGEHKKCWQGQADNFHYIFNRLDLSGNKKVLDLGAGRCWSTRYFSKRGCWSVGLDILLPKYIGLETGDIYINKENTFFERICGSMDMLPFRDSVFDIVFMAATLHHSSDISKPLLETSRVLKNNGRLVLVNETVKGLLRKEDNYNPEIEAGINENSYMLTKYINEIKKAGYIPDIQFWLGGNNRASLFLDSALNRFLPEKIKDKYVWKPLKLIQLFLFGGVLNLIARKR